MSQNQNTPPVKAVPASSEAASDAEKLSFYQKSKQFVKNHKKSTIAVGGLVGLVGLAALTGKKTQPLPAFEATLALEPPHASFDVETVQDDDTVTA